MTSHRMTVSRSAGPSMHRQAARVTAPARALHARIPRTQQGPAPRFVRVTSPLCQLRMGVVTACSLEEGCHPGTDGHPRRPLRHLFVSGAVAGMLLVAPPALLASEANGAPYNQPEAAKSDSDGHHKARDAVVHFLTGGVGGCIGAATVFPIDLVKTRLQAQKGDGADGAKRYSGGIDCFWTVLREEGPLALYSGLSAQLIGVWPEKAVKLTANDFVRGLLTDPLTGSVPLPGQMAAGAFGGLCQVLFTNPLEIIKIQLQLDGTRAPSPPSPAALVTAAASSSDISIKEHSSSGGSLRLVEVVEGIGFLGLYQGAGICAARDMFFSSMYFPLFSTLKESFATSGHQGGVWLLLAGTLAGAPAAYFSTPFDMIKTRAQAEVGLHHQSHHHPAPAPGAAQCLEEIVAEGGWGALFTGGVARVVRSAPQFGVTLFVYDQLNTWVQQALL